MTELTDKQALIFALVDAGQPDRLRQVLQVAAIVHFAKVDLQLIVVVANKSQQTSVARLELAFNVPGLCRVIEPSELTVDMLRGCRVALAPAGHIENGPALTAVQNSQLPIILQDMAAAELGNTFKCITVSTDLKRHFASALFLALTKQPEESGDTNG